MGKFQHGIILDQVGLKIKVAFFTGYGKGSGFRENSLSVTPLSYEKIPESADTPGGSQIHGLLRLLCTDRSQDRQGEADRVCPQRVPTISGSSVR
jgi:hypothetical protein